MEAMTLEQHEELQKVEQMNIYEELDAKWRRIAEGGDYENGFAKFEELHATWISISEETRTESAANKISAIAEQTYDNFSSYHSRKIQRGTSDLPFRSFCYFKVAGRENEWHTLQKISDDRRKERGAVQTGVNFPDYSSKFKKGTFVLCSQFVPCAGGNDLEDSQQKQLTVNGIYQHTLRTVPHCPNVSDYIQRATDKCAAMCTNNIQDGDCSYHCMRDSHKTSFVEFCAKPKLLFDYCPEYDPIGQTMQKDIYTPCKPSNPSERFYSSSDLFFCDQRNCLQLHETGVRTGLTSLTTDATQVSGDINDTWLSQYWPIVLLLGVALILCIVLLCIFRQRGRLMAHFQKWTKKGNPENDGCYEKELAILHSAP